ncbi:hypothetical protein Tco_0046116 [Tanacetum coccineum]
MDVVVSGVVVSTSVNPLIADVVTYLSDDSRKQVLHLLSDDSGKFKDFVNASIRFVPWPPPRPPCLPVHPPPLPVCSPVLPPLLPCGHKFDVPGRVDNAQIWEKELIRRRDTRKRECRIARQGLCRLTERIAAQLGALHDCRPAEGFAARLKDDVAKEMKLFDALEHKSVVIEVDGKGAWDAELDLTDLANYVTKKVLDSMGFVHVSISDYSRKMVNDVNVEIHRVKFKADFVVLDYANEGEHSIMFGRDFLTTTKRQVNFGLGKIKMNLTMFEEVNSVIDLLEEIRSTSEEVVKMGKANRNKGYNINKLTPPPSLKLEEIPSTSTIPPQPIYYPLTSKQREKMKEVLDIRYKELEELFLKCWRTILYKDLRLGDPRSYQTNLIMVDNTQSKAMEEVKNVRIQVGYQAYVVDLLVLDIPVDPELPLLFGWHFLRTCGAIIEMGRGEDDWLGNFEVGGDEDGNAKYGPVTPSFLDIKDDMERALAMEAYFNPFKNIIVFKKLVDFLGSLSVQLKNIDLGNEGYGTYKKIDGNGNWHAKFEIVTPSGNTLRDMMKLEYIYEGDGDVFFDYSWERALSIDDEVYT